MTAYWLTFTDGSKACCEGETEYDAKRIAEHLTGKKVIGREFSNDGVIRLPYPATPIIWQLDHPVNGKRPTFCTSPKPAGTVKVTFCTNQMAVIDLIQPGEKVGVIVWIPRKLLPGWMMPPKGKS